jgi:hypothetical protein
MVASMDVTGNVHAPVRNERGGFETTGPEFASFFKRALSFG